MYHSSSPAPSAPSNETRSRAFAVICFAALFFLNVLIHSLPASAQMICGEREQVLSNLAEANAEELSAIGLSASGTVIELLTSPSGDWTLLTTYPNSETCLLATGESWTNLPLLAATRPEA